MSADGRAGYDPAMAGDIFPPEGRTARRLSGVYRRHPTPCDTRGMEDTPPPPEAEAWVVRFERDDTVAASGFETYKEAAEYCMNFDDVYPAKAVSS